jgi:phosphoglycolate phosphatase
MLCAHSFRGPVEFLPGFSARPQISHVVFDFDGTLSWLRHGWPGIMCAVFREYFPGRPGETEAAIHDLLLDEILSLNGKPSLFQVERFTEQVRERGGSAPNPAELLQEYQRRLDLAIEERSQAILRTAARPDDFVIHGARAFLEKLKQRGLTLIILSGTIEARVRQEAALLDLAPYFGSHIYGSHPAPVEFSKRAVLDRLLREEGIPGERLLAFGDGPVEIFHAREIGGLTVAVASDEDDNGSGKMDPHKSRQLIKAGAHLVVPDYRDADALVESIFKS